ncbi:hypothetical protein PV05_08841 [Exophiala xenobiotica]|uniref:Mediator of RNA polymerase II transcription subunit 4 n=1 Tax=Exophiala xenobiotica TaxID=348802 RepID=A0A0D2CT89_9EURO|nr:uncharacterized protein PV05_08841 [Exophiala xenobiotica]KIW53252.1 hypothetical protein PV05_08841 [Exophiala xenobiotica]
MESLVLDPLNSIETHLDSLITSLAQTNTFASAPQIAKDLVTDDDNLTTSLTLLQRHQQNYARILELRTEVEELRSQLKDTIRGCVSFRQEIVKVHPSILDESDDEEEGQDTKVSEIDYHTLLAFAARIGKHNAAAAREAEAEAVRRKVAAKNNTANGVRDGGAENATAETEAELERINNTVAQTRAQMGMAFPDANILRIGALGQLQLLQEKQAGTGANVKEMVDREVERLVRESENIADAVVERVEETTTESATWTSPEMAKQSLPGALHQAGPQIGQPSSSQLAQRPGGLPPGQRKKKVGLDFPSSDDEDED